MSCDQKVTAPLPYLCLVLLLCSAEIEADKDNNMSYNWHLLTP